MRRSSVRWFGGRERVVAVAGRPKMIAAKRASAGCSVRPHNEASTPDAVLLPTTEPTRSGLPSLPSGATEGSQFGQVAAPRPEVRIPGLVGRDRGLWDDTSGGAPGRAVLNLDVGAWVPDEQLWPSARACPCWVWPGNGVWPGVGSGPENGAGLMRASASETNSRVTRGGEYGCWAMSPVARRHQACDGSSD